MERYCKTCHTMLSHRETDYCLRCEPPVAGSAIGSAAACDTYCIHYEGNRPDIKGVTYQEASSELEVRHDWIPGQHQLRIVKIEKLPNADFSERRP